MSGLQELQPSYCIQLLSKSPENLYLIVILINVIVLLLINSSTIFLLVLRAFSSTGRYVFEALVHIFSPYILACTLSNYIMLVLYNRHCSYFNTCDIEFYIEDPCCRNCKSMHCYNQLDVMLVNQSGFEYHHSTTDDILLISQMFVFYICTCGFHTNHKEGRRSNGFTTNITHD